MKISRVTIENFRCVKALSLPLENTTVFIGQNNSGKTAIVEAVRIALSRRWGKRGSGFTEFDIHCPGEEHDPKCADPVMVTLHFEDTQADPWDDDMVAALDELVVLTGIGTNAVFLRVTCEWSQETEAFEPSWQFLDPAGQPVTQKAARAMNFLSRFFGYAPLFYLPALRDAADEFGSRSSLWSGLLKSIRIPADVEGNVKTAMDDLDQQLLDADPRLGEIATTIGQATRVAISKGEGAARLRMLPMNLWDLISRASIVLRNEDARPWLPLDHHGQGIQSLSVIFLFQAAVFQQLADDEEPGTEPIFVLEEPEAHLHPQAARTLWDRISELPGQHLVTTHSPYFVQNVPLHNLRLARLSDGETSVSYLPRMVLSDLKWNGSVEQLAQHQGRMFRSDTATGNVASTTWFEPAVGDALAGCFKDQDEAAVKAAIEEFRHRCRGLVTPYEEHELSFLGRRIRGEIFFAREWILVEGQSEYVLLHAIGKALGYALDQHGIAVIDFQNNGDADIYPALATSFEIPWRMITDGDDEAEKFRGQLLKRGFRLDDLGGRFITLAPPNGLEEQLIADGHEARLRQLLAEASNNSALTCPAEEFRARLKNKKVPCISRLALQVEQDAALAEQMPGPFVDAVKALRDAV